MAVLCASRSMVPYNEAYIAIPSLNVRSSNIAIILLCFSFFILHHPVMLNLVGVLRWTLKPLDQVALGSAILMGSVCTLPKLLSNIATVGRERGFSNYEVWKCCDASPLGHYAFAGLVHLAAPYTASVDPLLTYMDDRKAIGHITERPWLQNPFNSVHAVALTNLGEFVSGILVTSQLQQMSFLSSNESKGIVISLGTTFHKKARGKITAHAEMSPLPTTIGTHDYEIATDLFDANGDKVATTLAKWHILVRAKSTK